MEITSEEQIRAAKYANKGKFTAFKIGGAKRLYLLVYSPNKEGISAKKYKYRNERTGGYERLEDARGDEVTFLSHSLKEAREIAHKRGQESTPPSLKSVNFGDYFMECLNAKNIRQSTKKIIYTSITAILITLKAENYTALKK